MADARLDLEVALDGDQQAAAGLDRVAKATEDVKDTAYGARQAHESWVQGYRGEVFSEMAEKIKRVSHVTKETNPELKWMGEGFKQAAKEGSSFSVDMAKVNAATLAAHRASRAYSQLLSGNFVGAARSAAAAVKALWAVMLANPFTAVLAGIAAAVAGLKLLMDWHDAAKEKARQHALEISRLGDELNEVLYGTPQKNAAANAGNLDKGQLESGIAAREKAIQKLAAEARKLKSAIDKIKVGGIGAEKEQAAKDALISQYRDLLDLMRDNQAVAGEYQKAIEDLESAHKKTAAAEQKASEQALENAAKKIDAEVKFRQEIDTTFAEYIQQTEQREAAAAGDIAAFEQMVSRRKELEQATDAVGKAEIERKHILEDIAEMQGAENANTLDYMEKQEELRQKENEIAGLKREAIDNASKEADIRVKGADSAKTAAAEKLAVTSDPRIKPEYDSLLQRSMARMKAMRAGNLENWEEYLPGGWRNQDESALQGSTRADGNEVSGGADPWSTRLDAIKGEIKGLRSDLVGGG